MVEGAETVKCKPWTERLAKKGAVETGVTSGLKKAHKPWELEAKMAHKPWIREGRLPWSANRELGTFRHQNSSVSVHIWNGQSTVGGPKWTSSGQNGPKWTILVHFGLANAKIQFGIRSFWPKWSFGPFWTILVHGLRPWNGSFEWLSGSPPKQPQKRPRKWLLTQKSRFCVTFSVKKLALGGKSRKAQLRREPLST